MTQRHRTYSLKNDFFTVYVDSKGGAFSRICLHAFPINPLSFLAEIKDADSGFEAGTSLKGHFLCLGRWGSPTRTERADGKRKHGDAYMLEWDVRPSAKPNSLEMKVVSDKEQLQLTRGIVLAEQHPLMCVTERVTNLAVAKRPLHLVQHPTFAAPFVHTGFRLFSNVSLGFDQSRNDQAVLGVRHWPQHVGSDDVVYTLDRLETPYDGINTFLVDNRTPTGWVLGYSPENRLVYGYQWPKAHYPYLSIWQQWNGGRLEYVATEFGTTDWHQRATSNLDRCRSGLLGKPATPQLDVGETKEFYYEAFIHLIPERVGRVHTMALTKGRLLVSGEETDYDYSIGGTLI